MQRMLEAQGVSTSSCMWCMLQMLVCMRSLPPLVKLRATLAALYPLASFYFACSLVSTHFLLFRLQPCIHSLPSMTLAALYPLTFSYFSCTSVPSRYHGRGWLRNQARRRHRWPRWPLTLNPKPYTGTAGLLGSAGRWAQGSRTLYQRCTHVHTCAPCTLCAHGSNLGHWLHRRQAP
jgi:hypothetical protein